MTPPPTNPMIASLFSTEALNSMLKEELTPDEADLIRRHICIHNHFLAINQYLIDASPQEYHIHFQQINQLESLIEHYKQAVPY